MMCSHKKDADRLWGDGPCSLIVSYLPKGVLSVPASFKARAMFHAVVVQSRRSTPVPNMVNDEIG